MSIKFKPISRYNLNDPDSKPKFYAVALKQGKVDIDDLSRLISDICTVSRADVYAVLVALEDVMSDLFSQGKTIVLGNIGTFSISLSSEGAESAEALKPSMITKARIIYRAGKPFRYIIKILKFKKR